MSTSDEKEKMDRPSIEELERLISAGHRVELTPDGRVIDHGPEEQAQKPLTLREPLGGEYCGNHFRQAMFNNRSITTNS